MVLVILPAAAGAALVACSSSAPPPDSSEKRYPIRGEVIRLEESTKVAVVKHEEIPGFMEAMTMGFPVPEEPEWKKLRVGLRFTGTVVDKREGFHITDVKEVQ
jgi:protein SCO1/2